MQLIEKTGGTGCLVTLLIIFIVIGLGTIERKEYSSRATVVGEYTVGKASGEYFFIRLDKSGKKTTIVDKYGFRFEKGEKIDVVCEEFIFKSLLCEHAP